MQEVTTALNNTEIHLNNLTATLGEQINVANTASNALLRDECVSMCKQLQENINIVQANVVTQTDALQSGVNDGVSSAELLFGAVTVLTNWCNKLRAQLVTKHLIDPSKVDVLPDLSELATTAIETSTTPSQMTFFLCLLSTRYFRRSMFLLVSPETKTKRNPNSTQTLDSDASSVNADSLRVSESSSFSDTPGIPSGSYQADSPSMALLGNNLRKLHLRLRKSSSTSSPSELIPVSQTPAHPVLNEITNLPFSNAELEILKARQETALVHINEVVAELREVRTS